jgi:two-component system response regulator DesR
MIRIVLALNGVLLRTTLAAALSAEPDLQVIGIFGGGEPVAQFARANPPDVAVIEVDGQDPIDGGLLRALSEYVPACCVVALVTVVTPRTFRRSIKSQVRGLVSKDSRFERLVKTIRQVADGKRVIEPAAALAALRATNPLTRRECDVLRLAGEGMSAVDIARRLYLAPGTVRNYLSAAARKVGAHSRLEAVRIAERAGWL